ncbi:MAG TPA: hypothetical protein VL181_08495 [Holophagaceae bacterium]|nr:hypothetical protein [Holophagaceae bacterium]
MKRVKSLRNPLQRTAAALAACLGLILLAPWPGAQAVLHAALVLGIALDPESALLTALWAAAGGWAVEGTLRLYPHYGGTPWADMSVALLAWWMIRDLPVGSFKGWLGRQALLGALWILAVHLAVRLAAGPHLWGWTWAWILLGLPFWGWLTWRWQRPGGR